MSTIRRSRRRLAASTASSGTAVGYGGRTHWIDCGGMNVFPGLVRRLSTLVQQSRSWMCGSASVVERMVPWHVDLGDQLR